MHKKKVLVRIIAVVLAILMVATILISVLSSLSASASTQSEIDDLKSQQEELESQQGEVSSEINSLQYEQLNAVAKKEVLDEQMILTQQEISNLGEQIESYNQLILDKQAEVDQLEADEASQMELYKTRIRAMEENGTYSYMSILFGATSFADFLARMDFIGEVMQYDDNIYNQLLASQQATENAIAELQATIKEQEDAKSKLEEKQVTLESQVAEASKLIEEINSNIEEHQAEYEQLQADEEAVQKELDEKLAQLEAERAAAEAANNGGSNNGGSGTNSGVVSAGYYIWPSYCNIVTCEFGGRYSPTSGAWENHGGVDIGAAGGTNILAAAAGTVVASTYQSSYGNYVMIYHDNGTATLYAHMSQRLVSVGDTVSQGEVIGLVGSTGNSTGNHIHFEVRINGSRVDPLQFFSNYVVY